MLSGHDTSIAPFLKIFFPDNLSCIEQEYKKRYVDGEKIEKAGCLVDSFDFTANIILELFDKDGKLFLHMNMNNDALNGFNNGKDSVIELEKFLQAITAFKDPNFEANCGIERFDENNDTKVYLICLIIAIIILIALVGLYFFQKRKEDEKSLQQSINEERLIL